MDRRLVMVVGFAAGAAALGCAGGRKGPPPEPDAPVVTVSTPVVKSVTQYTDLTGTVGAVQTVDVRPEVGGYILKVNFKDGDDVKTGQVLFEIDPRLYKADLDKAEADLNTSRAQLTQAAATAKRFEVAKGEGAVGGQEYDVAIAQRRVAEANVQASAATVERAKLNLGWTKVTSPIDGRVDRVYVTAGNLVAGANPQSQPLTTVVSVDPVYAYFDVDEQTVRAYQRLISQGKLKSVREKTVEAEIQLRDEKGYPHKGTLDFVSNRLNPATGTLQIRGTFPNPPLTPGPNPSRALSIGFFVRGRIPMATSDEAVLIPDSAITTDQDRRVVYVVGADNKVVTKPVVAGPMSDGLRVIEQGVGKDDRVIVRGMQRVQAGMTVDPKVAPAAPQPDVTASPPPGGGGGGGPGPGGPAPSQAGPKK